MSFKDVVVGAVIGQSTGLGALQGALIGGVAGSGLGRSVGQFLQGNSLVKPTTWALKKFYHMTFEVQSKGTPVTRHTLLVNPEEYSITEPARANVTQTLGGAYIDDFGAGLPTVTLSGITGYKARYNTEGLYVDGYEEFVLFRQNAYRNFIETNDPDMTLHWYNWEDNEFYRIQPQTFRLQRSARQPLLYRYEFQFVCVSRRGSIHTILDKIISDPKCQLISSFLGGDKSSFTKAVISMGMTGQNIGSLSTVGSSINTALQLAKAKAAGVVK